MKNFCNILKSANHFQFGKTFSPTVNMESSRFLNTNIIFDSKVLIKLIILLWLIWLWQRRHFYKFCWNFPTFWGLPLLGVLPEMKHPDYSLELVGKMFEDKNRDNLIAWGGCYPLLLTKDAKFIRFVLTQRDTLNKAEPLYDSMHAIFRGGLITNKTKVWRPIREMLEPCFNSQRLLSVLPIINQQKGEIIKNLTNLDAGIDHNIINILYNGILDLTMRTTMVNNETDKTKIEKFAQMFLRVVEGCTVKSAAALLNLRWMLFFYRYKDINTMHNIMDKIVVNSLQKMNDEEECNVQSPNIFVGHLYRLYKTDQITHEQIIGESSSMLSAAFETSAKSIFSSLVMLAMHLDIQKKVYEELKDVFPDSNSDIDQDELSKLTCLDRVLKETLRLMPPVPLIARHIRQDTKYKEWPDEIPKDVQVVVSIFHLHRDTKIWGPDAAEFKPERFSDENLTNEQRSAYIPFSKGNRNCIGNRYAMLSLKVIVAGILLNFELETAFKFEDLRFADNITLKYLEEPTLRLRRRSKHPALQS